MKRYRPAYCLSFWEPGVATFINVMNCPTRLVSVASQGMIFADDTGVEKGLLMRGLHQRNVGPKGTLVPLSVRPLEGAIPQVVSLPPLAPAADEPYFVAYSTVPQVRTAAPTSARSYPQLCIAPTIATVLVMCCGRAHVLLPCCPCAADGRGSSMRSARR